MKLNGKEITGCGVLETALDGLTAKAYCLELQYKSERKNGGYTLKSTSLPRLAKQNDDIAAILPDFVDDNWSEGTAYFKLEKFSEKYGIKILPAEQKRLAELKALVAERTANEKAKAAAGEGSGDKDREEKPKKAKKSTADKIIDILDKATDERDIQAAFIVQVLERIAPNSAAQIEELLRYEFQKRTTPKAAESGSDPKGASV